MGYAFDPYGVLRSAKGRQLPVYFAERKAKFLLSEWYVPENFDGLILGPSSSANWNPTVIPGAHLYNESLLGANVAEEKLMMEQALRRGHYKLVLCVIYPTMTSKHEINGGLDTVTTSEAFASIHAFVHEAGILLRSMQISFGKEQAPFNGSVVIRDENQYGIGVLWADYFKQDPVAVTDYREMVQELRERGAEIVYVVPPLYEPCDALNAERYAQYRQSILEQLPAGPVIDFQTPEYRSFRDSKERFGDCYHLRASGAVQMDEMLAKLVPEVATSYYGPKPGDLKR